MEELDDLKLIIINRIAKLQEDSVSQFDNNYLVSLGKIEELESLLELFEK